jgi:hypothetical protein
MCARLQKVELSLDESVQAQQQRVAKKAKLQGYASILAQLAILTFATFITISFPCRAPAAVVL